MLASRARATSFALLPCKNSEEICRETAVAGAIEKKQSCVRCSVNVQK